MRALLVALLLAAPVMAGCLAPDQAQTASLLGGGLTLPDVPEGAKVEPIPGGLRVVWDTAKFPFESNFTVPEGTTLVRATGVVGADEGLSIVMRHADTNRRRCQTPSIEAWNAPRMGQMSCIGLAAIDPLPATWKVQANGIPEQADLVSVELLRAPVEGPAALLDLSQLSMPSFELTETEVAKVDAHDGVKLHVEVTRPKTDEKVPTVIVSTPYNEATRKAGLRPSDDLILDWGARGYAIVVADVRGYGLSEGCVEVWSPNEQQDQVTLVEWVAAQPWSDGTVGFYGQSYVGTTPVEAAVNAPDALKAIVAVAPVINAYDDWHFGGVPNGEDALSPITYQMLGGGTGSFPLLSTNPLQYAGYAKEVANDPLTLARLGNGFCDPTLTARANDPRALYDAFYAERNFSARAADVKAAVLYTQGFEDSNVKSMMIPWWFNALESPKLGLFGHWVHQHPPRADQEILFLGWMDQYVKGKALGFEKLPKASVLTNLNTERRLDQFPVEDADSLTLFADLAGGALVPDATEGSADVVLGEALPTLGLAPTLLGLEGDVAQDVGLSGLPHVEVKATLRGGDNAYVAAFLYDVSADGPVLVTWGMTNLAHREGHDQYAPVAPGEVVTASLPLLPTDHVFQAGHTMRLELRGTQTSDWALVKPTEPGILTFLGGEDGTRLVLPTLPVADALPAVADLDWRPTA